MARREVEIKHIRPTSAFRMGLAMSVVGLVAWLLAVTLLYLGMQVAGVWESLNNLIGDVGGTQLVSYGVVISITALLGAVTAILCTILAPLIAVVYNACVNLFGGLSVQMEDA